MDSRFFYWGVAVVILSVRDLDGGSVRDKEQI